MTHPIRALTILAVIWLTVAAPARAADALRPVVLVEGRFGKALDARATPVHFDGDDRYRRPPLTVECWAKLFSKKGVNVLVFKVVNEKADWSGCLRFTDKDGKPITNFKVNLKP